MIPSDPLQPPESKSTRSLPQSLTSHSATYFIGTAITALSGIVMLPVYTRAMTPESYGLLETALRFVNVCMVVAFLGLRQAYQRFYFDDDSERWQKTLTATTLLSNVLIALMVMFPLLALGALVVTIPAIPNLTPTTAYAMVVWLIFEATFLLGLTFLQVRMRSRDHSSRRQFHVTTLLRTRS
jgi:O-antigen/teichoic acid export membrane protein